MNDAGLIVGYNRSLVTGGDAWAGFVSDGRTIRNVNELIEGNLSVSIVWGISASGKLTGEASIGGDVVAFVLTPVPASIADLNHDCTVDVNDLLIVIGNWGGTNVEGDLNGDGIVNVDDLLILIGEWTF